MHTCGVYVLEVPPFFLHALKFVLTGCMPRDFSASMQPNSCIQALELEYSPIATEEALGMSCAVSLCQVCGVSATVLPSSQQGLCLICNESAVHVAGA